jgi:hypothetical protein
MSPTNQTQVKLKRLQKASQRKLLLLLLLLLLLIYLFLSFYRLQAFSGTFPLEPVVNPTTQASSF